MADTRKKTIFRLTWNASDKKRLPPFQWTLFIRLPKHFKYSNFQSLWAQTFEQKALRQKSAKQLQAAQFEKRFLGSELYRCDDTAVWLKSNLLESLINPVNSVESQEALLGSDSEPIWYLQVACYLRMTETPSRPQGGRRSEVSCCCAKTMLLIEWAWWSAQV